MTDAFPPILPTRIREPDIVDTRIEVQGYRVRLGIEAPEEIRVLRRELAASEQPMAACTLLLAFKPPYSRMRNM